MVRPPWGSGRESARPDSIGQALWAGGGLQEISQETRSLGSPPRTSSLSPLSLPPPRFFSLFDLIWLCQALLAACGLQFANQDQT